MRTTLWLAAAALLLPAAALAQDVAGSHDHPLLGRFPGSRIEQFREADFDEAALPDRPIADETTPLREIEGRVTRIDYTVPSNTSIAELAANYARRLADAGFTRVFGCRGAECGNGFARAVLLSDRIMPPGFRSSISDRNRAYLGTRPGDGGDTTVFLYLMDDTDSNHANYIYAEVVEPKILDAGQIKVLAAPDLKARLAADGRVALYGLYFDTDSAVVRPDSRPQLVEMAGLLRADPSLHVYIVGHTDNQGSLAHNLALSQQRADSVARSLTATDRIDPARLVAKGVASLAPVATNGDEAGRTRNRRVELVLQ